MSENRGIFKYIIGFSALFVAFNAAFFSIFGLSKLFAGASLSVIVMASSLELGKLVGASFLHRYWNKISFWIKTYMTIGVVVLIGITSAGIFGFLSNAYQGATLNFEKETTLLSFKEDRLESLIEDRTFLKEELEVSVNSLPDNYITAKRKLREEYNPKIQKLNTEILNVKQEISDLEISLVETGVDVGPAIYLAKVFDTDVDTVVKFFIFILIFVFDPMAVVLVIATNIAFFRDDEEEEKPKKDNHFLDSKVMKEKIKTWIQYGEDGKEVEIEPDPEDLPDIENNERMDIIGQNGNDGEHYEDDKTKVVAPGGIRPSTKR